MDAAVPDLSGLKVVQFVPSLWEGGAERVAVNLALALRDRVSRLVVVSSGGEPYTSRVQEAGIPLELVPRPWPRPLPIGRSGVALAGVLRRERPDVVHAHNPGASAAAWLARFLARTPRTAIVTTYHGVVPERIGRANRVLAHFSDLVVGVGPTATRTLVDRGLPAEMTTTIFNAVQVTAARTRAEVRGEFGIPEEVPLIVNVGRYVSQKNQALLVAALARLARPFRALIVGYGHLEDDLRRQATEAGIGDAVTVTGRREDTADLIAAADVFALSSDWEALPLVILESLTLGTPVVTTAAGAVPDVIADGDTGLLVPRNESATLAVALGRLLDDPALAARLAEAGRSFVQEHCSLEQMAGAYGTAYLDALSRRRH